MTLTRFFCRPSFQEMRNRPSCFQIGKHRLPSDVDRRSPPWVGMTLTSLVLWEVSFPPPTRWPYLCLVAVKQAWRPTFSPLPHWSVKKVLCPAFSLRQTQGETLLNPSLLFQGHQNTSCWSVSPVFPFSRGWPQRLISFFLLLFPFPFLPSSSKLAMTFFPFFTRCLGSTAFSPPMTASARLCFPPSSLFFFPSFSTDKRYDGITFFLCLESRQTLPHLPPRY